MKKSYILASAVVVAAWFAPLFVMALCAVACAATYATR
jgi:hypothetical protein